MLWKAVWRMDKHTRILYGDLVYDIIFGWVKNKMFYFYKAFLFDFPGNIWYLTFLKIPYLINLFTMACSARQKGRGQHVAIKEGVGEGWGTLKNQSCDRLIQIHLVIFAVLSLVRISTDSRTARSGWRRTSTPTSTSPPSSLMTTGTSLFHLLLLVVSMSPRMDINSNLNHR